MAEIARKTRRRPTDPTDGEWERISPLLPAVPRRGRKPKTDLRELPDAIRPMARSGGGWRMLPIHFGPSRSDRKGGMSGKADRADDLMVVPALRAATPVPHDP